MPSTTMLKRCAVLLVGLGVVDLVWINLALGPRALSPDREPPVIVASTEVPTAGSAVSRVGEEKPTTDDVTDMKGAAKDTPNDAPKDAAKPTATPTVDKGAARSAIYFDSMSARVNSAGRTTLSEAARRAGPRGVVHLEGRADYRGETDFNERLSKLRVDSAAAALVKLGFAEARIERAHVGEKDAHEVTEDELWRDRRVDVWIEGGPE